MREQDSPLSGTGLSSRVTRRGHLVSLNSCASSVIAEVRYYYFRAVFRHREPALLLPRFNEPSCSFWADRSWLALLPRKENKLKQNQNQYDKQGEYDY
jgi:hypothetical protein